MADEDRPLGPISYLIAEFPGNKMTGKGFAVMLDLVERGLVRVLDLRFVTRLDDGSIQALELGDIDADGEFDFATVFDGASSGLLDDSDFADAAEAIEPGSSAGILIFENTWAGEFVQAIRESGAQVVAAGYIPQDVLLASLEAGGA